MVYAFNQAGKTCVLVVDIPSDPKADLFDNDGSSPARRPVRSTSFTDKMSGTTFQGGVWQKILYISLNVTHGFYLIPILGDILT